MAQRPVALLEPAGHTARATNTTKGREVGHSQKEMRPKA